jgi:hypothetical protein
MELLLSRCARVARARRFSLLFRPGGASLPLHATAHPSTDNGRYRNSERSVK